MTETCATKVKIFDKCYIDFFFLNRIDLINNVKLLKSKLNFSINVSFSAKYFNVSIDESLLDLEIKTVLKKVPIVTTDNSFKSLKFYVF